MDVYGTKNSHQAGSCNKMHHRINRMMDLIWFNTPRHGLMASKAPTFKQIRFCFVSAWNGRLRMLCKKSHLNQVNCLVGWMNCTVSSGWIMSNQWNPPTVNVISPPKVETNLAGLFEWSRMSAGRGELGMWPKSSAMSWSIVTNAPLVGYTRPLATQ